MATWLRGLLWNDDGEPFSGSRLRKLPYVTVAIPLFFAHLALAQLGWSLLSGATLVPVWPAAGLDLVALLLFGTRFWPVLLAAYLATTFARPMDWMVGWGISLANIFRALAAVWLFKAISRKRKFLGHFEEVAAISGAAVLAPLVSSGVGTVVLILGGRLHLEPVERVLEPLVDRGCARRALHDAGSAGAGQVCRGAGAVLRSKSVRQDCPAGRGRSGRMLLRLFPSRNLQSALLGVPVDPVFGSLGGTSRGPRQRPGHCRRRGMGDAHRRRSVRGRHRPGKPPEPEPVSRGRIADRPGGRGVPKLGQPVAAWHGPGGGMGVERMAVCFAGSGPGELRRSSFRQSW